MTTRELMRYLQTDHAQLHTSDGLTINIQIIDARQVFGRVDLLVTPADQLGHGQVWVDAGRVTITQ